MSGKRKRRVEVGDGDGPTGKKSCPPAEEEESNSDGEMDVEESTNLSLSPDFCCQGTVKEEAEVGVIEQVSLKNFMCHTSITISFCPQVNFIIGQNGSGKSAVLTAVVVGLGGKANITNRGNSIKAFIKHGKQSGEVTVTLRNRGRDAYKHSLYGDSILVERKLAFDGSSQYRLKNTDGVVISTKREELAYILEHFNIQVDNPMAILNQDTSRNFLHSKSPNDKYRFFLKATQLEQMKNDYVDANQSKEVALEILRQKKETLPGLHKEVLNWEQKYKASLSVDELRKKVATLKKEMVWALVYEEEKRLEPVTKDMKLEQQRIPKFQQKVEESQAKVQEKEAEQKAIQDELQALNKQVEELVPQKDQTQKARDQRKKALKTAQGEFRQSDIELKSVVKDRQQILERIEEIKNSIHLDYEGERRARESRIKELQEQLNTLQAQQKTTEQSATQFQGAITKLKEEQYRLRSEEQDVKSNTDQCRRRLRDLEASRNNKMRRFGAWVPELLQKIDDACKNGRFHKRPRGPLGANLSLREPMWARAVESCLKGLVHAFCVHDHHDEKELEAIFSAIVPSGRKPSTITNAFAQSRHDVSANRVSHDRYPTVLDMLVIEDHVVENCLIDQRSIENILLIKDRGEARQVMSSMSPPRNCREAFTAEGDQLYCVPTYRFYSSNVRNSTVLTARVEDDIRNCKEELRGFEVEHSTIDRRLQEITGSIRRNQQEERCCLTQLTKIREHITKCTFEITELKNVEDPAPVDITTLEEEVAHYDNQIGILTERNTAHREAAAAAKEAYTQADKSFHTIDVNIRAVADCGDPIKERLAHIEGEIGKAREHKQYYEKKKKDHNKVIVQLTEAVDKVKKEIEESVAKAEQICERIRIRRAAQNLESEIVQITKRIKKEEENRGNHEEIMRKYGELKTKYEKIKQEVTQLHNFLQTLDKVMTQRKSQYHEFRRMIALRAKQYFILMLHNRQYRGSMTFNHQTETLKLSVQPNVSKKECSKDIKALSGGERSFSTICFILALWEAMESPFRCLDEFDVFMDMVNRHISMNMMLKVTEEQRGRQFIFLTPQDMSQLRVQNINIRILEMQPPEREQTTLHTYLQSSSSTSQQ